METHKEVQSTRLVDTDKVWTSLITNTKYLPGLLTLDASLKSVGSCYPLVALYTDGFPQEGRDALDRRKIPRKRIPYLLPNMQKDFSKDPRFYDCWSKLTPFALIEFERVVQLDSDMLVVKNMDELMDLELDGRDQMGSGKSSLRGQSRVSLQPFEEDALPTGLDPSQLCLYFAAFRS